MAIPALHHGRAAPGDAVRPGPLPAADGPAAPCAQGTSLGDGLLQGPRVPGMNHALITAPWAKERRAKAAPGEQPGQSQCCSELEGPLHPTGVPWQPPSSPWVPWFHTEEGWWDGWQGQLCSSSGSAWHVGPAASQGMGDGLPSGGCRDCQTLGLASRRAAAAAAELVSPRGVTHQPVHAVSPHGAGPGWNRPAGLCAGHWQGEPRALVP